MAGKYDATMNDEEDYNGIRSSIVRSDYTSKSSGQHQSSANNNDQDDHDNDDEDDISLTLGSIIQTNNNEEGDDTLLPNMSSVTLDISCPYFTPRAEALASSINNSTENNCNTIMRMGASLSDEPLGDNDEKPLSNNRNNDEEESSEEIILAVLSTPLKKQSSDTSYREERRMNGLNLSNASRSLGSLMGDASQVSSTRSLEVLYEQGRSSNDGGHIIINDNCNSNNNIETKKGNGETNINNNKVLDNKYQQYQDNTSKVNDMKEGQSDNLWEEDANPRRNNSSSNNTRNKYQRAQSERNFPSLSPNNNNNSNNNNEKRRSSYSCYSASRKSSFDADKAQILWNSSEESFDLGCNYNDEGDDVGDKDGDGDVGEYNDERKDTTEEEEEDGRRIRIRKNEESEDNIQLSIKFDEYMKLDEEEDDDICNEEEEAASIVKEKKSDSGDDGERRTSSEEVRCSASTIPT